MLVVPQIFSDIAGTITNVITEKLQEGRLLQEHLFEQFNSEGHNAFLHDVSFTLIDKTDAKNPIKREHYRRHTLKTLAPHGLNVEDDF